MFVLYFYFQCSDNNHYLCTPNKIIMKKSKMLLVAFSVFSASMNLRAQNDDDNVVLRPRADEQTTVVRERNVEEKPSPVISQFHRLSFQGVSMAYGADPFARKLIAKGLKVKKDLYDNRYCFTGSIAGQKDYFVSVWYDEKGKDICEISALHVYDSYLEASKPCETMMSNLRKAYPHSVESITHTEFENGNIEHRLSLKVLSSDGKYNLGSVYYVLTQPKTDGATTVRVVYKDSYVSTHLDGVDYGLLDISSIMKSYFDHCLMFVDDSSVDFEIVKGDKKARVSATGDDREQILKCIFRDTDYKNAIARLQNYLGGLPVFGKYFTLGTSYCFDHPELYPGGKNMLQQLKSRLLAAQRKDYNISDFLMEKIFTKEELEYLNAYGSYKFLRNSLPAIFGAVGGNGSTQWGGLNDAQKAVIHEHDNAR